MSKGLTQQQFKERVAQASPNTIVLGKYTTENGHIKVRCRKCGYVWITRAESIMNGTGCPRCAGRHVKHHHYKHSPLNFKQVINRINPSVELLTLYTSCNAKIYCRCRNCGYKWWANPRDLLHGAGCILCGHKQAVKTRIHNLAKIFPKRVAKVNKNVKVLGIYTGKYKRVKTQCLICGYIWYPQATHLLRGYGCPKCAKSISYGEQAVIKYLKQKHYQFKYQFWFKDCRDQLPLPFDFAVFNKDGSINCLIEYQGDQHFYQKGNIHNDYFFKTDKNRRILQKHDQIKAEYCKTHNLKLIHINHHSNMGTQLKYVKRLVDKTLDKELKVAA